MSTTTQAPNGADHPVFTGFIPHAGPRAGFRRWAVGQFRQPHGLWGRVAGWIMATRPSNLERNRWTVELLDVQPADWVLELGFGPGLALGWLAERARAGVVVGIDHSELMLRTAARRNAEAIGAGRMALLLGAVQALPDLGTEYDKIMAVNVAMFWADPVAQFARLRERLRPGGTLALTFQPRMRGATDETARRIGDATVQQLHSAGFRDVRTEFRAMRPVAAVCVLAQR